MSGSDGVDEPAGVDGTGAADSEVAAEAVLIKARWRGAPRCPRCDAADPVQRRRSDRSRWRCRRCRYDFCVTSATLLHASKAPFSVWVAAACDGGGGPLEAVSPATRRKVLSKVEATGLGPGPDRLAALLTRRSPVGLGPLHRLASGPRRVLATLRCRMAGATAARVALDAGLSAVHARRCLRRLCDDGFVEAADEAVMWGYSPRRVRLWRLRMSDRTLEALPQIGWLPPREPLEPPKTVPAEFWYLFWSGECASRLTLPEDAVHVADTLVGGPDEPARVWALSHLPLGALRQLRTMRGYDTGPLAQRLDSAVRERSRG